MKSYKLAICLGLGLLGSNAFATGSAEVEQRFRQLEQRLEQLEHKLEEKDQYIAAQQEKIGTLESQVLLEETVGSSGLTEKERQALATLADLHPILYEAQERIGYDFGRPDRYIPVPGTDTALEFGGHVWQDVIYDQREMENKAGFNPSSMPTVSQRRSNESTFSAGPSKFYVKSFTPTEWGDLRTRIEYDMFQTDGSADFNLAHLWGELGSFGAGQTFSNFMDIGVFPNTLEYWGPNSMVFVRQPQIRYTHNLSDHSKIVVSMEDPGSDITLADGIAADGRTEIPDTTLSYLTEGEWGHFKAAGMLRQISAEALDNSGRKEDDMGWGLNLSGELKFGARDRIVAQLAFGEGIASYMNDPCCSVIGGNDGGVNEDGEMEAIEARGGFIYFDHWWSKRWSSSIGYSYAEIDPLDVQVGQAYDNSTYTSANLIWYPFDPLKVGFEIIYGEVEDKAGSVSENTRYLSSVAFHF